MRVCVLCVVCCVCGVCVCVLCVVCVCVCVVCVCVLCVCVCVVCVCSRAPAWLSQASNSRHEKWMLYCFAVMSFAFIASHFGMVIVLTDGATTSWDVKRNLIMSPIFTIVQPLEHLLQNQATHAIGYLTGMLRPVVI